MVSLFSAGGISSVCSRMCRKGNMRFLFVVLLLICCGCGSSGPEIIPISTAKVNGSAFFNGKPLENYRVYFYVSSAAANEPATDRIKADGTFTLSVRQPGDGAIIGENTIWFSYDPELPEEIPGMETGKAPPPPTVKLPEKYLSADTSGLTVTVTDAGLTDYKIDLKN